MSKTRLTQAMELDVVNGLRTGAVRLRRAWTRCEQQLSQTSATSGKRYAMPERIDGRVYVIDPRLRDRAVQ